MAKDDAEPEVRTMSENKNESVGFISDPLSLAVEERDHGAVRLVAEALAEGRVMLAFQPVVSTSAPEHPAFYEGLIRVMDRTGRIIPARNFIGSVEMTELGRKIDCMALKLGLQVLEQEPTLRLAINMSARSIGYAKWKKVLNHGLKNDPSVAERLILEITESSAMVMPDVVQAFMSELQSYGISFALDDFGAGYTAFRYLRDFYFDIVKIDGGFIRDIHKNPDNQVLTKAIISLAKHFEMYTVAEFVESEQDAEFLINAGIDCMQGYYFGAPTVRPIWLQNNISHKKSA